VEFGALEVVIAGEHEITVCTIEQLPAGLAAD
jgi:hypothetical protein